MKRIITIVSAIAAILFVAACQKNPTPDGKCGIESILFEKVSNPALSKDITGKIDGDKISFIIPTSITETSFTATFTATEFDEVKIDGVEAKSGEAKVKDGSKIEVSDNVSGLSANFSVTFIGNDEAAELVAVVIKASDNEDITEDIAPDNIASEMLVRVPGAAFQKKLKIAFEAGFNDAIKVNGEAVETGAAVEVDTKFPIDIEVSDNVSGIKNAYVLKVGKILNIIVNKIADAYQGTDENLGTSYMAVNPVDGMPYVAYVSKYGEDAYKGVYVAKWDGSAYNLICQASASGGAAAIANATVPVLAFNASGEAFVKYVGGEVKNFNTVKKFNGSDWTPVGEPGITSAKINTSYQIPLFFLPGSKDPMTSFTGNDKNAAASYYRSIGFLSFNGSAWTESIPNGLPRYGDRGGSDGMYYSNAAVETADKTYSVFALNQYGFYVLSFSSNGSYEVIISDYVPDGETCGLPGNIGIDCAPDGTPYIFEALWKANSMQVYKVDVANKTLAAFGAPIKTDISASTGSPDHPAAFGINPTTGQIIVAIEEGDDQGNKTLKFKYMDEGANWVDFPYSYPVGNENSYTKELFLDFNKDGVCYVHARIGNNKGGTGVEGIHLFSISLEEDILPE